MKKFIIAFALLASIQSALLADQNTATLEEILAHQKKLSESKDNQERLALQSKLETLFNMGADFTLTDDRNRSPLSLGQPQSSESAP